ncbi:hypothetical protein BKA70DRAFT_1435456 [Coprinopsis sp. MPI-PUGE-AT-0042]|nr:hypothetical protein BKA70DRAFT_1435456 [Coprinopsis sp. MPI-PUGE-AT-0042]
MIPNHIAHELLQEIEAAHCSFGDLFSYVISTQLGREHAADQSLCTVLPSALEILGSSPSTQSVIQSHSLATSHTVFQQQMNQLVEKVTGFHFNVTTATPEQVEAYDISDQADKIQETAPDVWKLLDEDRR